MKKLLYVAMLFFAVAITCGNTEKAAAKTYKAGKFKYQYKNTKKGVWITKITPISSKGISKLDIPDKIKGKKVVKLGSTIDDFAGQEETGNLFGILFEDRDGDGIETISNPQIYKRVAKIKKIKIPSSVVSITPKCFDDLQDGKEINIPRGVEKEVAKQLTKVKWKKVKISSKNKKYKVKNGCLLSKSGKRLYGLVYKKKKLIVPKTVTKIDTSALSDTKMGYSELHGLAFSGCETLVISKNVKSIYLYFDFAAPIKVEVDPANKYYASKDGSLYSKKNGELICLHVIDGVYNIPDGVKVIPYRFNVSQGAKKVIIPASVKKVSDIARYICVKDAAFVCYGKEPPVLTEEWTNYSQKNLGVMNLTVYVPKGCKAAYESAWKVGGEYQDRIKLTFIEQ